MKVASVPISSVLITLALCLVPSDAFAQSPSPGAAPSCSFVRSLYRGLAGNDVSCLQNWLLVNGYPIPAGATGYFGMQTQTAVASWQRARGIYPAAGYFGPISQRTILPTVAGTPTPTASTAALDALMSSVAKEMKGLDDDLSQTEDFLGQDTPE